MLELLSDIKDKIIELLEDKKTKIIVIVVVSLLLLLLILLIVLFAVKNNKTKQVSKNEVFDIQDHKSIYADKFLDIKKKTVRTF